MLNDLPGSFGVQNKFRELHATKQIVCPSHKMFGAVLFPREFAFS